MMRSAIGFLIDMDGVIYRGPELIPGAVEFIAQSAAIRTSRSCSSPTTASAPAATWRRSCNRMGIAGRGRRTSSPARWRRPASSRSRSRTARPTSSAKAGCSTPCTQNGYAIVDQSPDYVVVGEGRTLSFEMLEHAVQMVLDGAKLIATNLDPNCPTQHGTRPGCGAIVSLIEVATGIKAFSVGKPSPVMMRMARKELGMATQRNDHDRRHDGDRHPGRRADGLPHDPGAHGRHEREDLAKFAYQPGIWSSIRVADLCDRTRELEEIFPPIISLADDTPHDLQEWIAAHA